MFSVSSTNYPMSNPADVCVCGQTVPKCDCSSAFLSSVTSHSAVIPDTKMFRDNWSRFLWNRCLSCHPTNSDKASNISQL